MNIVIFGMGRVYKSNRDKINNMLMGDKIVAFFDNKIEGITDFNGVKAVNPRDYKNVSFDYVLLMSASIAEMREQLIGLGVAEEKIYTWEEYKYKKTKGIIEEKPADNIGRGTRVLIITHPVAYDGGSMAAIYAAMSLRHMDYDVWLASESIECQLEEDLKENGICYARIQALPYIDEEVKKWTKNFEKVIVNVFLNIMCAYELSKVRPVLWWLHEAYYCSNIYRTVMEKYPSFQEVKKFNGIHVVAVSNVAKRNFKKVYPLQEVSLMPYGIPDWKTDKINTLDGRIVFAIIGTINYRKGHDILFDAIEQISAEYRKQIYFYIIGKLNDNRFIHRMLEKAKKLGNIQFTGELTRRELAEIYPNIDIIISASREDPLPIVITEAMMNGRPYIISDSIGNVDYVKNYENGIIFRKEDAADLAAKICWCINNRKKLNIIGMKARKIYEENFSMESFAGRLAKELDKAEHCFVGSLD